MGQQRALLGVELEFELRASRCTTEAHLQPFCFSLFYR
jgi:hypothetical protein